MIDGILYYELPNGELSREDPYKGSAAIEQPRCDASPAQLEDDGP